MLLYSTTMILQNNWDEEQVCFMHVHQRTKSLIGT